MISKRFRRGTLFLAALGAAAVLPHAAGNVRAEEGAARRPSVAEIEKLHGMLKLQPGESRWMEVDWHPTVWEARQKAAAEGKPIFLWAGSGGAPAAGC